MLDSETKRRIDTARDILVGKVPDPKSQVEQITIALIYKFMDDMDAEAEEMGGKRKFFAGDYARYGWAKLMRAGLGGHEMLNLYGEAIAKMPENSGIPMLFRDIFKNAYLPYRDPETLKSFLKIIDEFAYDHSERLGDAFEYLLSVLGSQGDAGQFRTPRHIIDFIVRVVDPKKDETILDPACGTAGFLISSYKHILRGNTDAKGNATLTPDEKGRLAANLKGYDISPDMVRLSLVNLYLHGFSNPRIDEYDTLTSEEKWNEFADVILANPPFMSPKGGIKPHKRFGVQSKRSEVLFVDYMAEHLTPAGRAGIIVPEGIIFQSQGAYKELRKMLVDHSLVAVVSLPAGVFNPYSGVKTSILILDKSLARQADSIAFFKVENDGFGLGAQRREIEKNDLPQVEAEITAYMAKLRAREPVAELALKFGLVVSKAQIGANGDYNLSGERYRVGSISANLKWPLVAIGELCVVERGASPRPINDFMTDAPDGVNWIKIGDAPVGTKYITSTKERVTPEGAAKSRWVKPGDFLLSNSMSFGRPYIMATDGCIHDGWLLLRDQSENLDKDYLYSILGSDQVFAQFKQAATGGVVNNLNSELVRGVRIPLPPLEVQREIVGEIEGYQRVIDGARAVLDNYRPHIPIDPAWPVVAVGEVFGKSDRTVLPETLPGPVNYIGLENISQGSGEIVGEIVSNAPGEIKSLKVCFAPNEILYGKLRPNLNKVWLADREGICSTDILVIQALDERAVPAFYAAIFRSAAFNEAIMAHIKGAQLPRVGWSSFASLQIPLPPLETQQAIVAEIEAEQRLVAANRELIERFEAKIQATLARVWGEDVAVVNEARDG